MISKRPTRLTAILTHPIQYYAPWFRFIHAREPRIALTVIYATRPTAEQQGVEFGCAFEWDVPLLDGYRSIVLRDAAAEDTFGSRHSGVDAANVGDAIAETQPDVVLIPGWHAPVYRRALAECRSRHIPIVYRGDTNLRTTHGGVKQWAWRLHTRRRLGQFDAYASVGTRAHEYLRSFGVDADRVFASPHAVDNEYFAAAAAPHQTPSGRGAARARFGLADQDRVVLFAGKLDTHKRPLDALRAAAAASTTLLIAGAGPLERALRDEAAATGAQVRFAGFLNQSEIAQAYAAADCLVLPSDVCETWGLVVNEAMATGLPCVVADSCGCAPDLIDDTTGIVFRGGDVDDCARALRALTSGPRSGAHAAACRERAARFDFAAATDGLVAACRRVQAPPPVDLRRTPRVIAWCGHFVQPGGLERATFEVFRAVVARGGTVHAFLNGWDSSRIARLADLAGVTTSTTYYRHTLSRRTVHPRRLAGMLLDVTKCSAELVRESRRLSPTHVFLPDFLAAIRCAPALTWLRLRGVPVIMRVGNPPTPTPFYRALWRGVIDPLTSQFVPNSKFTRTELRRCGIPARKISYIYNTVPTRATAGAHDRSAPAADVIFVGQLIPDKGVDILLEAIAVLGASGLPATLNIVGDVDGWVAPSFRGYRESLRARAAAPDLAGRVRFLGFREDVPDLLAAALVHCCPSRPEMRESLANVVIEAKRTGIPSVVSPVGSLPEIVSHRRDGWVCDELTPAAIASGLRHFLVDPTARRAAGDAARASCERFNPGAFAEAWGRVFASAASGGTATFSDGDPVEVQGH